jgi:hypothetical protein
MNNNSLKTANINIFNVRSQNVTVMSVMMNDVDDYLIELDAPANLLECVSPTLLSVDHRKVKMRNSQHKL